ncbi:thioredoxin domain-containing protein [Microbacterium sp. NPDC076911]|uniref:DsbA family protein n=1 Tax=Microbacterium sp. NPDC076911 TaxID=3154958 RepID=UPI003432C75C
MAKKARKTNWFAIWISVGILIAVGLLAWLVVAMNNQAGAPGEQPVAANIETETGAILVGDAENRLDTYVDFMCPICGQFELSYGPSIETLVDDGTATLGIHPISILDRASQGTDFSTRAANAMYCVAVADSEAALPFMQAMFANQPAEGTTGLTDADMLSLAELVGVTGIDSCVDDGTYTKYVGEITELTPIQPGSTGIGTPTVAVNGVALSNSELPAPDDLASLFN